MPAVRSDLFEAIKAAGPSREDSLARITLLAKLMDSAFLIPGLNRRIGLDAVIGLVPGIGDALSAALASYIIWEARQLGVSRVTLQFDFARHRRVINLAKNYVRLNEFPEWFIVEPNWLYRITGNAGQPRLRLGSELMQGESFTAGDWTVTPVGPPPYGRTALTGAAR